MGDAVSVCPESPEEPLYIARVCSMWEEQVGGAKLFHALWLNRSCETVLGETGDPCELFLVDSCDDNPLGSVMEKVDVSLTFALLTSDLCRLIALVH